MAIMRSDISQQINKPGAKGRKNRRSVVSKNNIKKTIKKLKKDGSKFMDNYGGDIAEIASYITPATTFAYELLKPTKAGSAELYSKKELASIKRKEKENEKAIKKYMGGTLNKRSK